jgi:hypothetical protein
MATDSSKQGSLDLTATPSEDTDALAKKIESFYKTDSAVKTQLAWAWERNHLFLDGKQWIVFEGDKETGGQWKPLKVSEANEYIPRPVTNYVFDAYQTLKSYMIKNKPRSSVTPNTQTYRDKSASKIGNLILEGNWERLKEPNNYEYAAACVITYGTVFKKSFWDTTTISMAKVPRMETVMTMQGPQEAQAKDPESGELLYDELPLGDVNTEVVEPYRIALDPLATDLHKSRWIMEYSIQPLDYIKEVFGKTDPGYTGRVDDVKAESNLNNSLKRFADLKNSSGVKGHSMGTSASESLPENCAVLKDYFERPSMQYPKGRRVVVANGICLYAGDTDCEGSEHGDWHPYSECRWELVPGRFWGKSPLDAVVEIQKQVNSIDSVIVLTRKTTAIPQKLLPLGCGVPKGTWTGRPGQEIEYRDTGGGKPEIIPATGVDASVFAERDQRKDDIKNISGAIDILKGDRPPGVTAASALNLLYEVGTGKLFPILDRWKVFVETDQKKQLKLVGRKYKEPRPDFIRTLKMKNTELSEQEIDRFIGSDLYDNYNVVVEAGSNVPKLQAAKQAQLQEAAAAGTLGLESPANRLEYNRQMGIHGFDNEVGPDVKRAEWENDLLENVSQNPQNAQMAMVMEFDKDDVHIDVHERRMKEPSFMQLPFDVQQAFMMHTNNHKNAQSQKMQEQLIQAQMSGMPPDPSQGPGNSNAPTPAPGHGKGPTREMKNAMAADAMLPGQPKGIVR